MAAAEPAFLEEVVDSLPQENQVNEVDELQISALHPKNWTAE